jgi:hypothetical protein
MPSGFSSSRKAINQVRLVVGHENARRPERS